MDAFLVVLTCLLLSILCWLYLYFRRMDVCVEISESYKYLFLSIATDVIFFVPPIGILTVDLFQLMVVRELVKVHFSQILFLDKLGICSQVTFLRTALKTGQVQGDRELHIRDEQFGNVPVRIYEPKHPFSGPRRCIIYTHGGVGMVGTIRSYAGVCCNLALKTGSMVVDIEYRLAPEHRHPAQFEDCMSAVIHLLKEAKKYGADPNRVILAGDSSGGTLASLVCHHLVTRKDIPRIRAQLLFYPALQAADFTLPSYQQNKVVPALRGNWVLRLLARFFTEEPVDVSGLSKNAHVPDDLAVKYRKWISADHIPEEFKVRGYVPIVHAPFSEKLYKLSETAFDPDFCPLLFEDDIIRKLPETFLLTCEYDVLRDDGLLYKKRLEDNGVPLTWLHLKKGFHGILFCHTLLPLEFKEAENAIKHIADFVQRC